MKSADMSHAARASASLRDLTGVCFQPRDQSLEVLCGHFLSGGNHQWEARNQSDRLEILHDVILEIVQSGIGDVCVPQTQADCVAVRSSARHATDGDASVCSANVF